VDGALRAVAPLPPAGTRAGSPPPRKRCAGRESRSPPSRESPSRAAPIVHPTSNRTRVGEGLAMGASIPLALVSRTKPRRTRARRRRLRLTVTPGSGRRSRSPSGGGDAAEERGARPRPIAAPESIPEDDLEDADSARRRPPLHVAPREREIAALLDDDRIRAAIRRRSPRPWPCWGICCFRRRGERPHDAAPSTAARPTRGSRGRDLRRADPGRADHARHPPRVVEIERRCFSDPWSRHVPLGNRGGRGTYARGAMVADKQGVERLVATRSRCS